MPRNIARQFPRVLAAALVITCAGCGPFGYLKKVAVDATRAVEDAKFRIEAEYELAERPSRLAASLEYCFGMLEPGGGFHLHDLAVGEGHLQDDRHDEPPFIGKLEFIEVMLRFKGFYFSGLELVG